MKESDIKKTFADATAAFDRRLADSYAKTYLAALQGAVKDLQAGGMNISLVVRPRGNGVAVARPHALIANATTVADGYKLDWITLVANYNQAQLIALDGAETVAEFTSERGSWNAPWPAPATPGAVPLKDAVIAVILQNLAQAKAAAGYDVPAAGNAALDKKTIAPPKLRTPGT